MPRVEGYAWSLDTPSFLSFPFQYDNRATKPELYGWFLDARFIGFINPCAPA